MTQELRRPVAVDGVSLDVAPGEVVGLLGDNGAGKSTLIKCVSGVYQPDEGEILFDGATVTVRHPDGRAPPRHRDDLPRPRARQQSRCRAPTFSSAARSRALSRRAGPDARRQAHAQESRVRPSIRCRSAFRRLPNRSKPVRRPAPGGRDRPRCLLGRQADDHGRADQQPRRARTAQGAGTHPHACATAACR